MLKRLESMIESFEPYLKRQNLAVALFGFSSGLPIMMTLMTLTYWLSSHGVKKEMIGLASLLGLPYAFKFLWAPLLDQYRLPLFGLLGRRKGWILFFQLGLALVFVGLSFIDPKSSPVLTGLFIFILAFFSASQDIVIDAYRIDYLTPEEQSYGSSSSLMTYRLGMLVMGAGVLSLSDYLSWGVIFMLLAGLFMTLAIVTLFITEPEITLEADKSGEHDAPKTIKGHLHNLFKSTMLTFKQFFTRDKSLIILFFIICYKLPDAISGVMVADFYTDMGYNGTQIGVVTKVYGLIATLIGAFVAGSVIRTIGIYKSLLYSAVAIGVTNLGYLLILHYPTIHSLVIAITLENFVSGFASALFIMFLSLLCDRNYSATQYALLSSLSAVGLRLLGGSSGFLVAEYGWYDFFIGTAFLFIPGVILLFVIRREVKPLTPME